MTHPLDFLIDLKLSDASRKGELDDLPGAGKPLTDLHQPKDAVIHRLLTEAKAKPPAVVLSQKISASWKHLKTLTDEAERKAEMKKLAELQMRLAMEHEAHRKYG